MSFTDPFFPVFLDARDFLNEDVEEEGVIPYEVLIVCPVGDLRVITSIGGENGLVAADPW